MEAEVDPIIMILHDALGGFMLPISEVFGSTGLESCFPEDEYFPLGTN